MNVLPNLVFLFGFSVIFAQDHGQPRPDCCLNELCPYDCVRCDGRATCYDLSDELGCHNGSDSFLKKYPKPPIFMPSVMETVKSHLLKQKKELASTYPHRICVKAPPTLQYGQATGGNGETPVWFRLLEKLKAESAATTTTTTTETPVWLLLLERLKAELASRKTTTTTTPRPTTTTEQSLIDIIFDFLQKKQAASTQDSLPTPDYTQIKPTEKQTAAVPKKEPSTSTQQIPKSTILFSQTDVATLFSKTEAPSMTVRPTTSHKTSLVSTDAHKDENVQHREHINAIPKSPIDSIYSMSEEGLPSSGFIVKTVSQSSPKQSVTQSSLTVSNDSNVSPILQNVAIQENIFVSNSTFDTDARSVDSSVTTQTLTTGVFSNPSTETANTSSKLSTVANKMPSTTNEAISSPRNVILTTVSRGVTGFPISAMGGQLFTSTSLGPNINTKEKTTDLQNHKINTSTESYSVSSFSGSSESTTFNNESAIHSSGDVEGNVKQEIVTVIPRSWTSTDSFETSTESKTFSYNIDKLATESLMSETTILQGLNVTDKNDTLSDINSYKSYFSNNSHDVIYESKVSFDMNSTSNQNNSFKLSDSQIITKLPTTEAVATEASEFRQTITTVTTQPLDKNTDQQKHANPVKLFVNLSEISEMVHTSSNSSNSTTAPPTVASRVITSLFSNPTASSKTKQLESSVKLEQKLRSEPSPTEWTAGSMSQNAKDANYVSVGMKSDKSLLNVKDSFLTKRNTLVNPDTPKVTERPVQRHVSPSIPQNVRHNVEVNSNLQTASRQSSATSLPDVFRLNMIPSTTTSSWWDAPTTSPFGLGDIWGRTTTFPTTTSSWWTPTTVNSFWNSLFGYAPTTQGNSLVPGRLRNPVFSRPIPSQRNSYTPRPLTPTITQTTSAPIQKSLPTESPTLSGINANDKIPAIPTTTHKGSFHIDSTTNLNTFNEIDTSTKFDTTEVNKQDIVHATLTPKTQPWIPNSDISRNQFTLTTTPTTPFTFEVSTETSTTDGTTPISSSTGSFRTEQTNTPVSNMNSISSTGKSTGTNNIPTAVTPTLAELRALYLRVISQRFPDIGTNIYDISNFPFINETKPQSSHSDDRLLADVTQTPIVTTTQEFVKPSELSRSNSTDHSLFNWWHSLAQSTTYQPDTTKISTVGSKTSISPEILNKTQSTSHTSFETTHTVVTTNASGIKYSLSTTVHGKNIPSTVTSKTHDYHISSIVRDYQTNQQSTNSPATENILIGNSSQPTGVLPEVTGTSTEKSRIGNRVAASVSDVFTSVGNIEKFVYELDKELRNRESRAQIFAKPTFSVTNGNNLSYNITEPPLAEWSVTSKYQPFRSTSTPNHSWWSKIITAVTEASPKVAQYGETRDTQTITYDLFKKSNAPLTTQSTQSVLVEANRNAEVNIDVVRPRPDQVYVSTEAPVTKAIATKRECKLVMDGGEFCKNRKQGYYKNHNDCRTFFVCEWSNRFMCHCPPGTMFDVTIDVCNWDANVTC